MNEFTDGAHALQELVEAKRRLTAIYEWQRRLGDITARLMNTRQANEALARDALNAIDRFACEQPESLGARVSDGTLTWIDEHDERLSQVERDVARIVAEVGGGTTDA
jgi:predicted Zn-dependent protease